MEIALPMVMPDYFEKTEARILQEFAEAVATWGQSVTALAAWEAFPLRPLSSDLCFPAVP